eukprot:TRINITY_DN37632_c0_g1_i1.p2 TRINITY_DN37632_c0_g1~~TRINITY_DN37632_c0_g1_i1.p2  ORF type:complete len:234 (-),score=76.63 TRINITY_DN37632_c0_g1_i1:112-813(-)
MGACAASSMTSGDATANVEIYGMPISGNVIPCVTFATDSNCGKFVFKDMLKGELKSAEMLAVNPWSQMPSMKDGGYCLAESGAILRYLANVYNIEAYGGMDAKARGTIDWALDWIGTNFGKNYANIWYPVAGFGAAPDDQKKANQDAVDNLNTFAAKFLPAGKKFISGDRMSIADHKLGCLVWYLDQPAIKKKTGFELPPRFKTYVQDYLAALSPASKEFLKAGEGFMQSKEA